MAYDKGVDSWKGANTFGKIVCVDLDGCVFDFSKGWQGPDVFGEIIDGAHGALHILRMNGWYIVLFTTRIVTPTLLTYLCENGIPFDDINGRVYGMDGVEQLSVQLYDKEGVMYDSVHKRGFYWKHNPFNASIKPIASVYIDDMSWENEGKTYTKETWVKILNSLLQRFP